MSEEEFEALMDVIEAKISAEIEVGLGRDSSCEFAKFNALKQDFIDTFIFGD